MVRDEIISDNADRTLPFRARRPLAPCLGQPQTFSDRRATGAADIWSSSQPFAAACCTACPGRLPTTPSDTPKGLR
eukprot:10987569-Alexandrium_andersonii.AAC.1